MCECCQQHRKPEVIKPGEYSSEKTKELHDKEEHSSEKKEKSNK